MSDTQNEWAWDYYYMTCKYSNSLYYYYLLKLYKEMATVILSDTSCARQQDEEPSVFDILCVLYHSCCILSYTRRQ